ncbi:MAG: hypothetical protein ACLGHL_05200 [Actinomycetota bacterium]
MELLIGAAGTVGALGVIGTAFTLGLRHGADWDHIAALLDISGMPTSRRRSMFLCLMYALGHAFVLIVLGSAAILFGQFVPTSIEAAMGKVVGATLVLLGLYLLVSLFRYGDDIRPRGRWSLVVEALGRMRRRLHFRVVEVEHEHPHDHSLGHAHDHGLAPQEQRHEEAAPAGVSTMLAHSHRHTHRQVVPVADGYAAKSAVTIGMLHGVGAETPTQVLLMVTTAGLGGRAIGLAVLLSFVAGLLITNTVIAAMATYGILRGRSGLLFRSLVLASATFSLIYGAALLAS